MKCCCVAGGSPGSRRRVWADQVLRAVVAERPAPVSGWSENAGFSTGFPKASPAATRCGASGWENKLELSMWVPYDEEVGRYALITGGRRSNRTLSLWWDVVTIRVDRQTRLTLNCTDRRHGRLPTHQPLGGRIRRAPRYGHSSQPPVTTTMQVPQRVSVSGPVRGILPRGCFWYIRI